MKNLLLILFIFLLPFQIFSQESILDKIALETCEYLENDGLKNIDSNKKTEKLGLFIISLYNQYQDELLKEGFEINFTNDSDTGRAFGEKVGVHMVKFCPDALISLAKDFDNEEVKIDSYNITGKLIDVKGDEFSIVSIKDEDGKVQKFLWLQNFKGSDELIDKLNKTSKSPSVQITYKNLECYSPQLKEYIIRKEILEMSFID